MIIGILVIILIITGYLNFAYNQNILNNSDADAMKDDENSINPKITISDALEEFADDQSIYDDQLKDVSTVSTKGNFFVNYRIERENTRKSEIEYIKEIVDNPNSEPDMKREAQVRLLEITSNMEKELVMEGLIKAKGFEDAIVLMNGDNVNVIVARDELKPEEVAQILDIVKRESGKSPDSIKIIPMV